MTLDDISIAIISLIRAGAVFRFVYCMVRLQGAEEEQAQYRKRAKNTVLFYIVAESIWQIKDIVMDCQHFFRQIFLGYFSDIVQAFDTLRKNVCGDDYTSLHNPIVLSSVLPAYGMFHSIQILFL